MTIKTIRLTYKGHGIFTTRQRISFRKGQAVRAFLGPTPLTDATRGIIKVPARLAKRIAEDPELSVWNS